MILIGVFVLVAVGLPVTGERHSLTYLYTSFSKPVSVGGIPDFVAMGMLDQRIIDYYDSVTKKKVPRQRWMEERLEDEYWKRGTASRDSKKLWFQVNTDILMTRLRYNDSGLHILQWKHGCEADADANGKLTFRRGMDMYSFDGDDFLYFDDAHKVWVAPVEAARETKRKWDVVKVLKDYTVGYLESECVQWLQKFLQYSQEQRRSAPPPEVYMFAKRSKVKADVVLTCLATGFYPRDVTLNIRMDGRILTREDGVETSGIRPNGDDTYQRRDQVELLWKDVDAKYVCELIHSESGLRVETEWDHKLPVDRTSGWVEVIALVLGAIATIALVVFLFVRYLWGPIKSILSEFMKKKPIKKDNIGPSGEADRHLFADKIADPELSQVKTQPSRKDSSTSVCSSDSGLSSASSHKSTQETQGLMGANEQEPRSQSHYSKNNSDDREGKKLLG
ncbi:H-2 class I histocompatibility antigen, Q10 alpha chain-like [Antennarius striatus]|uniref:H-2 class I histocompatibility antigen, Q10 alpha chain-like n=1 Tax=Antennarius striatus TaxID=241820 RepID=UPI0035B2F7CD